MPTLVFRKPDGTEVTFDLTTEASAGRVEANDIVLADPTVSRRHCRFFVEAEKVFVEDAGSAGGTFVDGQTIAKPTPVAEGTEVKIGAVSAWLATSQGGPGRKCRATRMVVASEMVRKAARRPRVAPALTGAHLVGTGAWQGRVFPLNASRLLVGRTAPADIALDDDSVSRRHAEFYRTGTTLSVRDLESANGTFVNGVRISDASIEPGDTVRFGVVEFVFHDVAKAAPRKGRWLVAGACALAVLVAGWLLARSGAPAPSSPDAGQLSESPSSKP